MALDLKSIGICPLHGIYMREFEKYADSLAKGKQSPLIELEDVNKVHNTIVEQRNIQGCAG